MFLSPGITAAWTAVEIANLYSRRLSYHSTQKRQYRVMCYGSLSFIIKQPKRGIFSKSSQCLAYTRKNFLTQVLWIQSKRFKLLVRWEVRETLLEILSKTKRTIIWVWSFLGFFCFCYCSFFPGSYLLWLDAIVFPKRECSCCCMSGGKLSIIQNVSQAINNVS